MNESTEFEERNSTLAKEWEHDLKLMKEENEKLFKNCQTLKISQTSVAPVHPTTQDDSNLHVTSRATQVTTEVCNFFIFLNLQLHHRGKAVLYITFQSRIITLNVFIKEHGPSLCVFEELVF